VEGILICLSAVIGYTLSCHTALLLVWMLSTFSIYEDNVKPRTCVRFYTEHTWNYNMFLYGHFCLHCRFQPRLLQRNDECWRDLENCCIVDHLINVLLRSSCT